MVTCYLLNRHFAYTHAIIGLVFMAKVLNYS